MERNCNTFKRPLSKNSRWNKFLNYRFVMKYEQNENNKQKEKFNRLNREQKIQCFDINETFSCRL